MRGIQQMIFDQSGARSAFQKYLSDNCKYQADPWVKSVRMTRGGKFIVEVEDEQTHSAAKAAAAKINPEKREEICASSSSENGTNGTGMEQANAIHKISKISNNKAQPAIRN